MNQFASTDNAGNGLLKADYEPERSPIEEALKRKREKMKQTMEQKSQQIEDQTNGG